MGLRKLHGSLWPLLIHKLGFSPVSLFQMDFAL